MSSALVDEDPNDPDALALEAEAYVGQADVEKDASRDAQAEALYLAALPGAEAAAKRAPSDVTVLDTYSRVLSRLGTMAQAQAKRDQALSYFQRGLEVDQKLLSLSPGDEALQDAITGSYQMLGSCQQDLGVSDNGIGFDTTAGVDVFAAFKRMHRTDQFEGSGIGLSIVQRMTWPSMAARCGR